MAPKKAKAKRPRKPRVSELRRKMATLQRAHEDARQAVAATIREQIKGLERDLRALGFGKKRKPRR